MSKREEIQEMVSDFVVKLTKKMREAGVEAVNLAFGDDDESAPAPAKNGRKVLRAATAVRSLPPHGTNDYSDVLAAIRSLPHHRSDQIAATMGKTGKDIRPAIVALVKSKQIKKSGSGRATTYTVR